MGATQTTESTAVARRAPVLPADIQRAIDERKLRNLIASQIAGLSWGKDLDLQSRRALADYCQQRGIDAATEIHILGGRIYKNGEYYLNRAQPLVRAGLLDLQYEYVNVDPRLEKLAASANADVAREARAIIDYRAMRRIEFNIPDAAQSAVVATVAFLKHGTKLRAAKWCGGGTRKRDPVGDDNPEATAVTRAMRKVLKMAVGHEPALATAFGELDEEDGPIAHVEAVIAERRATTEELYETVRENQQRALEPIKGVEYMPEVGTASVARLPQAELAEIASRPDPYETPARVTDPDDPRYGDTFPDDEPALPLGDTRATGRRDALREGA